MQEQCRCSSIDVHGHEQMSSTALAKTKTSALILRAIDCPSLDCCPWCSYLAPISLQLTCCARFKAAQALMPLMNVSHLCAQWFLACRFRRQTLFITLHSLKFVDCERTVKFKINFDWFKFILRIENNLNKQCWWLKRCFLLSCSLTWFKFHFHTPQYLAFFFNGEIILSRHRTPSSVRFSRNS